MVHRTCTINGTIVGLQWGKWLILHRKSGKNVMQCLPYKQVCVTSTQGTKETIGLIMLSTHGNSIPHKFVASVKHAHAYHTQYSSPRQRVAMTTICVSLMQSTKPDYIRYMVLFGKATSVWCIMGNTIYVPLV